MRSRKELRRWLRRLHDEMHISSVFVTHDQEEALEVADRVVVMNHGKIEQIGSPDEVYNRPNSIFVAGFIGAPTMNFIACRLTEGPQGLSLTLKDGTALPLPARQIVQGNFEALPLPDTSDETRGVVAAFNHMRPAC